MAYLRMKSLRPRTPALIRSAYINGAPSADTDPPTTQARYLLRSAHTPIVTHAPPRRSIDPAERQAFLEAPHFAGQHIPGRIRINHEK